MSVSSLAEEPEAGQEAVQQDLPGAVNELRFASMMASTVNVSPDRVSIWRSKRKRLRFPLAPAHQVDLGPWQAFGWAVEDLPAARAHFASLQRYEAGPFHAYFQRFVGVMGPHLAVAFGKTVIAESTRGFGILTKSGWFARGGRNHRVTFPEGATTQHRAGLTIVVGTRASGQYFHWMVEMLPRLVMGAALAREHQGTLLLRPIHAGYQWETLAAIAPGTRVAFAEADITTCDEVMFPDHVIQPGQTIRVMSPLIGLGFDALLASFATPSSPPTRRLYISRRDAARRHVTNETDLEPILRRHGFEIVTLSGLKAVAQAALFRQASIVIGLHGAGLTNTGFCQPGTPVVEILPIATRFLSPYYSLAGLRDLPYLCLAGHDGRGGPPAINGDYVVEPAALEEAILAAEGLRRHGSV